MTEISADTSLVDELPAGGRMGREGRWTELVAAALDGKARRTAFSTLLSKEDMERVRRQLSHTANERHGKGIKTVAKVEGDPPCSVVYWQVVDKRERTVSDSTASGSTPATAPPAAKAPSGSSK